MWPRAKRSAELEFELAAKELQLQEAVSQYEELRHRVRNDFQALTALLSAQARVASQPEYCQRCILRRTSAAELHSVLDSGVDEVSMGSYLAALSEALKKAFDDRLSIETVVDTGTFLDRRRAQCVGLIYAEAVMNALKHAFPDGATGKLEAHLHRIGNTFQMTISDNGVGFDPNLIQLRKGHGVGFMKELAERLRGTLQLETLPVGTMVDLVFAA